LNWLVAAAFQGTDAHMCKKLVDVIKTKRLLALDQHVMKALIQTFCGGESVKHLPPLHKSPFPPFKKRPKGLEDAMKIMFEHLEEPLAPKAIGEKVGCSARQLSRWFESYLSTTPAQYYASLRLEHAHYLLLHSSLTVTEIAVACGYHWAAQFSKAYRLRYGTSPRGARKSNQERSAAATRLIRTEAL
jgi:transcriptional regulator GlxA family with amidase domain